MPAAHPAVITEVTVTALERLSPSFVRIEFGGAGLAGFGVEGPLFDQRIKLLFPAADGRLPQLVDDPQWYQRWRSMPPAERGHLRTYSVREVTGDGSGTRLVVDFVLHQAPGRSGPAGRWAAQARPGERLVLVGPRRGVAGGGIEFAPEGATTILLAADETAVPAASRILEDLPAPARGIAFLEVPRSTDVLSVAAPRHLAVRWLPRDGRPHGELLVQAVAAHLGAKPQLGTKPQLGRGPDLVVERSRMPEPDIWETPTHSSSGERIGAASGGIPGLYAWIAGESGVVTRLRRHLVHDLGADRSQVAFMGYWRDGVAASG